MQESVYVKPEKAFASLSQDQSLADAYDLCEAITRRCSKSFYLATVLLPRVKRRAVRTLYAFCRQSDDLVDISPTPPVAGFERWVAHAQKESLVTDNPILYAWHDLRTRYQLSSEIIADLLAGIRMDLSINRYATFADLWLYCYRVAGTVGLLSMQIIGSQPGAEPYAIKLGVALQLTNILRDVGEDAQHNRIYLPQDELAAYGLTDADVLSGNNNAQWQRLMRFQIQRARQFYQEAWPGIPLLNRDSRHAVAAAAVLYRAILNKIEANQYDNFSQRAFVPKHEKLWMLPGIWWKTRKLGASKGMQPT